MCWTPLYANKYKNVNNINNTVIKFSIYFNSLMCIVNKVSIYLLSEFMHDRGAYKHKTYSTSIDFDFCNLTSSDEVV